MANFAIRFMVMTMVVTIVLSLWYRNGYLERPTPPTLPAPIPRTAEGFRLLTGGSVTQIAPDEYCYQGVVYLRLGYGLTVKMLKTGQVATCE
jgi:hypothetical protein